MTIAGCAEGELHAPRITSADERALLQMQSLEAMESNEALGTPTAQGAALANVLALRRHLSPVQRAEADAWIGPHVSLFAEVYVRFAPASFPRDCPFHQAERAFAVWLKEPGAGRTAAVFEALYALPDEVLPTLDRTALAVDRLPHEPAVRDGFVAAMTRRSVNTERLADTLAKRADPALAEKLFTAILNPKPAALCPTASWSERVDLPAFVRVWNATYLDLPTWTAGARAFAAAAPVLGDPDRAARALLQQAWRIWPERRATLLYVLASASDPARYAGAGAGARFEVEIGPRPTDEEMVAMARMAPGDAAPVLISRLHEVRAAPVGKEGEPSSALAAPVVATLPTARETLDSLYGGSAGVLSTQSGGPCLFPPSGTASTSVSAPLAGQARLR